MNTLLLTLEYPPFKGGVANYYGHLAKYWPQAGNFEVWQPKKYWWGLIPKLIKYWRQHPDNRVIVGHLLPLGTVALIASWFTKGKYIVVLHGMDFNFAHKKSRKAWISKLILKHSYKVVAANSRVQSLVLERYPNLQTRSLVVNPGISEAIIQRDNNLAITLREKYQLQNKLVLLTIGRLVPRKGVDTTLKAISLLSSEEREKIFYVVVGRGPADDSLRTLAHTEDSPVLFTGEVDDQEKWSWLDLCDIFVMPAREIAGDFEGFGIVYLEANLYNKPVIAGNSGGVSDAVSHEVNGLLVDPENPKAVAEAIRDLLNHPDKRERLGREGRHRALTEFSWTKQVKQFYQAL